MDNKNITEGLHGSLRTGEQNKDCQCLACQLYPAIPIDIMVDDIATFNQPPEQTTVRVEITKSERGWSVRTEVKYPDFNHPAVTYKGARTLNHALWDSLNPMDYVDNARLISLTVKGHSMHFTEAYNRIHAELIGGSLSWALPRYQRFLLT